MSNQHSNDAYRHRFHHGQKKKIQSLVGPPPPYVWFGIPVPTPPCIQILTSDIVYYIAPRKNIPDQLHFPNSNVLSLRYIQIIFD